MLLHSNLGTHSVNVCCYPNFVCERAIVAELHHNAECAVTTIIEGVQVLDNMIVVKFPQYLHFDMGILSRILNRNGDLGHLWGYFLTSTCSWLYTLGNVQYCFCQF